MWLRQAGGRGVAEAGRRERCGERCSKVINRSGSTVRGYLSCHSFNTCLLRPMDLPLPLATAAFSTAPSPPFPPFPLPPHPLFHCPLTPFSTAPLSTFLLPPHPLFHCPLTPLFHCPLPLPPHPVSTAPSPPFPLPPHPLFHCPLTPFSTAPSPPFPLPPHPLFHCPLTPFIHRTLGKRISGKSPSSTCATQGLLCRHQPKLGEITSLVELDIDECPLTFIDV